MSDSAMPRPTVTSGHAALDNALEVRSRTPHIPVELVLFGRDDHPAQKGRRSANVASPTTGPVKGHTWEQIQVWMDRTPSPAASAEVSAPEPEL